jgi:serine protease
MMRYTAWQRRVGFMVPCLGLCLMAGMMSSALTLGAPVNELQEANGVAEMSSQTPPCSTWNIIVKFKSDVTDNIRHTIIRQNGCSIMGRCAASDVQLLQIPDSLTVTEMVELFQAEEAVDYAELNYHTRISLVPDDTFYSYQWNLNNRVSGGIDAEAAWDIQRGDPNVIIAVLDTGVAYEDFGRFKQAPDLKGTRFVAGYDFVHEDTHPNDDQGHGTHVAGTIAQSTNNKMGAAGLAFGCSIMPVKVMNHLGIGTHFDLAGGIYFATDNGAKVINMSLGAAGHSITLRDAVAHAYDQGVTVVCAAGNEFMDGNPLSFPAAYNDYCIAVGATRYDETRAYYSNTGSYLDVVAPGGDMLQDQNRDGQPDGILQQSFNVDPAVFAYLYFQGTSMAAPHVSGTAALLISSGITEPDEVQDIIRDTATDLGPRGWDAAYGWGLINAGAALGATVPESVPASARR